MKNQKIKICRIVTVPIAFVHIRAFIRFLQQQPNVDLKLISSDGLYKDVLKKDIDVDIEIHPISREISLKNDFRSLIDLFFVFRKNKFSIIHSSTPKAGLLVAIAGFFYPSSVRIHTFTGQRWATLNGPMRSLLKFLDRLIIKLNTQCYADSPSQIDFMIAEGVAKTGEVKCINLGSYGGIDISRFDNDKHQDAREIVLKEINGSNKDILILYVGRMTRDKGVEELIAAFEKAQLVVPNMRLVLVGPYEAEVDAVEASTLEKVKAHPRIDHLGFKTNPELYFSAADVFCLPSYREGFGTVVLEAAACGLMSIGTRIPGLVDSIAENETGLLVEKKNIEDLKEKLIYIAKNPELRKKLSAQARLRARAEFDSDYMARLQWEEYQRLLKMRS